MVKVHGASGLEGVFAAELPRDAGRRGAGWHAGMRSPAEALRRRIGRDVQEIHVYLLSSVPVPSAVQVRVGGNGVGWDKREGGRREVVAVDGGGMRRVLVRLSRPRWRKEGRRGMQDGVE